LIDEIVAAHPSSGATPPLDSNPETPVILIIHQDDKVLDLCRGILEKQGFIIDTATNGTEGIQKAYRTIPDVVLAGSSAPELNGYQICRLIKNDSVMRKIPVLLISDLTQKMERFWGMKAGADDFLQKDELETKLLRKIKMVLEIYDRMDTDEKQLLKADHEKNPFNIRTRLNQILDTALVESMLMVEFRSLADLVHDPGLLNYMLFSLLESILEYDAAAIFYNDESRTPRLLTIHLPEGRKQSPTGIEAFTADFFNRFKGRDLTQSQLEMTESEVIGILDESVPSTDYATRYVKEVHIDGRLLGAIALYSQQRVDYARIFPVHLLEDETRLLMKLRNLYSQAETLALIDSLTGLFNQKHFMMILQREFKSAVRYEQELSLALIGIDNFKRVNDEWGHACGDEVLRHIAQIAEACFRSVDIPARFGGKYLAVILPSTPGAQALHALDRFREQVAEIPLIWQDTPLQITVSCGLVSVQPEIQSVSELIRQVEEVLHQARRQGSNRIEISPT
jgi:two-component system cell cycle response regulator